MDTASWSLVFQTWAAIQTLVSIWMAAHRSVWSPAIGILNFIPWTGFAIIADAPVLIAFNAVIAALHIRTFIHWRRL